jgi:predicted DsbA family dithiol-disulfide isomerase
MRIDFVSDVACPWCAIGLNALERALERIGDDIGAVELHMQPSVYVMSMAVMLSAARRPALLDS